MKELYVYVHIPFCYRKCPYCAFVSYEKRFSYIDGYVQALVKQIGSFNYGKDYKVKTIYLGGGTPTSLKIDYIGEILEAIYRKFTLDLNELTIEAIPNDIKPNYVRDLRSLGFNRISIGIQSFRDEKLEILGRIHNSKESIEAVETAFRYGFENISIDLIYGIFDSLKSFERELEIAVSLPVKHISSYMITIEEHTPFFFYKASNRLKPCSDEIVADLYLLMCQKLPMHGFNHYEISNFSFVGYESKHNMAYWTLKEYAGFGVSAASFIGYMRLKNTDSLEEFIKNPVDSVILEERLGEDDLLKEAFILGLRLTDGIVIEEFNRMFGTNVLNLFSNQIGGFKKLNLIKVKNGRIFLNGCEAMLVSNSIFSEFI